MKKLFAMLLSMAAALALTTCAAAIPEPEPDYLALMTDAAMRGDVSAGREAESLRAIAQADAADYSPVSFDELYLLSRYICARYGSFRCTDELRLCAGEVMLNRVASPEYPDSLEAVIFQPGQIDPIDRKAFDACRTPTRECVMAALRLLLGERMLEPSVVLMTDYPAKDVYAMFCDSLLGNTYLYKSENLTLYAEDAPEGG